MRVRRAVSAWLSSEKRGNCRATSGSAASHSATVAASAITVIEPITVATRRRAAASPCRSRARV